MSEVTNQSINCCVTQITIWTTKDKHWKVSFRRVNHQKMRVSALFLVLLVILMMVELSQTARGVRGSSRAGRSRNRSRTRSVSSGSSSKPKITKYTPIPATSVRSPVIVKQTRLGSRSGTFKKVVAAYLVRRYMFSNAPVYRSGYPMYRSYVAIPTNRAVRLSHEEEKLLNDQGELCLGELAGNRTLEEGIDENLVELNTTVKYNDGTMVKLHGFDNTISLKDIKDQGFEITTLARYNTSIVAGTTCTQVEMTVEGTVVTMYETNPNGANIPKISNILLPVVFSFFVFSNIFLY